MGLEFRVFQNTKNEDHPNTEVDPVAKTFLHLSPVTRRASKYRYQKLVKLEGQLTEAGGFRFIQALEGQPETPLTMKLFLLADFVTLRFKVQCSEARNT